MSVTFLAALVFGLGLATLFLFHCEADQARTARKAADLADAKEKGSHKARLQYPHIDLSRCLGCGTCVRACPEEGVLALVHGQSAVIHGARCVGHGLCAKECPVDAINLTLADLKDRRDIPVLTESLEAEGMPGMFLAGEVTGRALIRTAISQGTSVADEVANRIDCHLERGGDEVLSHETSVFDLCIVGAGPAGLAAALRAKERGLNFVVLEQESIGGTVAKYPRRKLVMTQPVDLPLHGRLKRTSYSKEELMELWEGLARKSQLPVHCGVELLGVEQDDRGTFSLKTSQGEFRCRHLCLALGRRGSPRKLGVPGEELSKVTYSLIDAQSYRGRRIVVVGGGDSAVEAAIGLAEQPRNAVTLSYRKDAFFRIKARNETRLAEALRRNRLQCILGSEVCRITPTHVHLKVNGNGSGPTERTIENDDVFVMAGGVPPFKLLEKSGVSFDPALRPPPPPLTAKGTGLGQALLVALALSTATLAWVLVFHNYYALPEVRRPESPLHSWLRPSSPFGLTCGILASALIVGNLGYLLRRALLGAWIPGSLRAWMTSHVVTGVLALLLALLHGALTPQNTNGGHAFWALAVLLVTGAIGRYFYSFVPHAVQGTELKLEEVQNRLAEELRAWEEYGLEFAENARREINTLVTGGKWRQDFVFRLIDLLQTELRARDLLRRLQQQGQEVGLDKDQVQTLVALAKRTYRTSLQAAHHEDVVALLASWRFFHRWVALLMILFVVVHIVTALRYANVAFSL